METKAEYNFKDIAVDEFKDYPAADYRTRQKVRSAAWGHGAHHGKKFSSKVIDGGLRITRIK